MDSSSSDPDKSETGGGGAETSEAAVANDKQSRLKKARKERVCTAKERISKMPPCAAGKRSSIYRGVTRHRWTGRYEAHLWDKSSWNQNQNKKGKQGAYDDEEAAARAYDLAALKYWGPSALINFPVTDYARDLEEMQKVSREEYLASLRRKSSGFSRGLSKYRGLSSRWEPTYGRMAGSDYVNNIYYGEDSAAETKYISSFCIEKKIDLTSYIKWWGSNKCRQPDAGSRFSDIKKYGFAGGICYDLKTLEQKVHPSEPYQLPELGMPLEGRKHKHSSVSALSILSQSAAYKNMQEKASKRQERTNDNDENENENTINKLDRGKAAEKLSNNSGGNEGLDVAMEMSESLALQRSVYPLTTLLSAPLLTAYNAVDPSVDHVLWTPLVPILPAGPSHVTEVIAGLSSCSCHLVNKVTKTETSSTYPIFQLEE